MKIEIVSHCYCGHMDQYARHLCYQLSSLWLYPPEDNQVEITVVKAREESDELTAVTAEWWKHQVPPENVKVSWMTLPIRKVCRRSIGRNIAAQQTSADWIWFTDCDYLFRSRCLDSLADVLSKLPDDVSLAFPRHVHRSSQEDGDALTAALVRPAVTDVERTPFIRNRLNRAIGGIQIVRGSVAREIGYLPNDSGAQEPSDYWLRTFEDVTFRRSCPGRSQAVEVPGIFRIRHSQRGSSFDRPTS